MPRDCLSQDRRGPDQEFRQIKHLDTKAKCLLQGEQMRKGSEPYTREEIARLAHDIQEEIKVRNLKKRGTTEAEKKYEARLHTALEGKVRKKESRGRSKRLDFATQQEKADKAQTDHNRDWNDKDSRKYSAIVSKVATKGHFNKCGSGKPYYEEILNVLPYMPSPEDPSKTITYEELAELKKSKIKAPKGILGNHLDDIKLIAAGKKNNTTLCDDDELKDKSFDERMKVFVLADKSGHLARVKEEMEAKQKKLGAVHSLVSGKIASRFMKMMRKISEREDDGH